MYCFLSTLERNFFAQLVFTFTMGNINVHHPVHRPVHNYEYVWDGDYFKCLMKVNGRDQYCFKKIRGFENLIVHLRRKHGCKLEVVEDAITE